MEGSAKPPPFMDLGEMTAGQMKLFEDYEYLQPLFMFKNKMPYHEFDQLLNINKPKPINKWYLEGSGNEQKTYYNELIERFRN